MGVQVRNDDNRGELKCFDKAISYEKNNKQLKSIQEEMKSLHVGYTFELVKLPKGKKSLKNKWVFRLEIKDLFTCCHDVFNLNCTWFNCQFES